MITFFSKNYPELSLYNFLNGIALIADAKQYNKSKKIIPLYLKCMHIC